MRAFLLSVGEVAFAALIAYATIMLALKYGRICVPIDDDHQRCLVTEDRLLK